MIVYFDTSALVPLLIDEPGSAVCGRLWEEARQPVTIRATYVEARAALASAVRHGWITAARGSTAVSVLEDLWQEMWIIELTETLMRRAADLTDEHALRGYDAMHCAGAAMIESRELVAAADDTALLDAWSTLGIAVSNTAR